ncbi:MAG: translation elongation factor Ts [Gemmatimonadota bacterium]
MDIVAITAAAVKSLRDRTGAGMMDCKKALQEAGGDEERAIDLLRQRGAAKAAKRAAREAREGAIQIASGDRTVAMVELLSETDFVSRNERFVDFARRAAEQACRADLPDGEVVDGEVLLGLPGGEALATELDDLRTSIGENLRLARVVRHVAGAAARLGAYLHFGNRIGVLVELAGANVPEGLPRDLAMHIAAARPEGVSPEDIPAEARERERAVFLEQARAEGKPPQIMEKIVEGRMRKFYEQSALLWQSFVKDPDRKIRDLLSEAGEDVEVRRFVRFEIGD